MRSDQGPLEKTEAITSLDLFDASSDEYVIFISMERIASIQHNSTLDVSRALNKIQGFDGKPRPCKLVIIHGRLGQPNLAKQSLDLTSEALDGKGHLDYEQYLDSEPNGITDQFHFLGIQVVIARPDGHIEWMGCCF